MPTVYTKSRLKKKIPELMPVKKWLSLPEACAYMDMSINIFQSLALKEGITTSVIGKKKYYLVYELDNLLEKSIIIHATA